MCSTSEWVHKTPLIAVDKKHPINKRLLMQFRQNMCKILTGPEVVSVTSY